MFYQLLLEVAGHGPGPLSPPPARKRRSVRSCSGRRFLSGSHAQRRSTRPQQRAPCRRDVPVPRRPLASPSGAGGWPCFAGAAVRAGGAGGGLCVSALGGARGPFRVRFCLVSGHGRHALWGRSAAPSAGSGLSQARSALPAHRPWRERGEGHLRHAPRSRWESVRSGPCPPRETLQSCRREDPTCCGGGSFSVLNLTTPRVRAPGPPHSGHVLGLLRSIPSFCQSPISDAERSFFRTGHGVSRASWCGPRAPAGSGVRGGCRTALAVCGSARVPRRREPRVVGPVSHPKHLSVTRLLAPPSPVPLA